MTIDPSVITFSKFKERSDPTLELLWGTDRVGVVLKSVDNVPRFNKSIKDHLYVERTTGTQRGVIGDLPNYSHTFSKATHTYRVGHPIAKNGRDNSPKNLSPGSVPREVETLTKQCV